MVKAFDGKRLSQITEADVKATAALKRIKEGIPFPDDPDVPEELPWASEDLRHGESPEGTYCCGEDVHGQTWEPTLTMDEVSHLLDQMIMDIQHLELEVVRARYKLSFYLSPPYDGYLRQEIFSSMGSRYGGDPVYDKYLSYCGLGEYDDAIDTPFHLKRKRRLAAGHDDYPDLYP